MSQDVSNFLEVFRKCASLNSPTFDLPFGASNVSKMYENAGLFDQDISGGDFSSVSNLTSFFK